jgi:NUMOD3 motif
MPENSENEYDNRYDTDVDHSNVKTESSECDRRKSDWAQDEIPESDRKNKICKRRVVDFSVGAEDYLPSHQRLTHKGGYAHTKMSRLKISQANSGNVPWNKGMNRTSDAKAKISAGVRARNQAILVKKLEKLGMTEEEWINSKRKIKLLRERVRKTRYAAEKDIKLREIRRIERMKLEQTERAMRKLRAQQELSDDDDAQSSTSADTDVDNDDEQANEEETQENSNADDVNFEGDHGNENVSCY